MPWSTRTAPKPHIFSVADVFLDDSRLSRRQEVVSDQFCGKRSREGSGLVWHLFQTETSWRRRVWDLCFLETTQSCVVFTLNTIWSLVAIKSYYDRHQIYPLLSFHFSFFTSSRANNHLVPVSVISIFSQPWKFKKKNMTEQSESKLFNCWRKLRFLAWQKRRFDLVLH